LCQIVRLAEPLLRFLWPASGRHRLPGAAALDVADVPDPDLRDVRASGRPPRRPLPYDTVLRGEDSPLVRPYLVAHERGEEAKRQRARRRALWLAVHGVDVGPRHIHGIEVAAA
jgi:hypothetical protein